MVCALAVSIQSDVRTEEHLLKRSPHIPRAGGELRRVAVFAKRTRNVGQFQQIAEVKGIHDRVDRRKAESVSFRRRPIDNVRRAGLRPLAPLATGFQQTI